MTKQLSEQEWIDLFNSNLPEVALPPGLAEGLQQRVLAEVELSLKPLHAEIVEDVLMQAWDDSARPDAVRLPRATVSASRRGAGR